MSRLSTMLIRETDEERTLVDPRFWSPDQTSDGTAVHPDPTGLSDPEPPFQGSGKALSPDRPIKGVDEPARGARSRWRDVRARLLMRELRETIMVLALILGVGAIAYQQSQVADRLRETIDEIQASKFEPLAHHAVPVSSPRSASLGSEPRLRRSTREVADDEREALESHGASLIGSNDFHGALTHYEMLGDLFPGERAYRDVIHVLRTKVGCANPAQTESRSCL